MVSAVCLPVILCCLLCASALPQLDFKEPTVTMIDEIYRNEVRHPFVTQLIELRQSTITVTKVTTVTRTRYETCTAVSPGTPPCQGQDLHRPDTETPDLRSASEVHSLQPSCPCSGEAAQRTPRLLQEPPMIVLTRATTVHSTATVILSQTATTITISYAGCVPADAITAPPC